MLFRSEQTQPTAEAVAILGNRIAAIGSTADLRALAGPATRVIDAGKKVVLPGFNDAHVHFLMGGFSLSNVDLRREIARRNGAAVGRVCKEIAKGPMDSRWRLGP